MPLRQPLPSPRVGPSRPPWEWPWSALLACPMSRIRGDSSTWGSGHAASTAAEQCWSLRTAHSLSTPCPPWVGVQLVSGHGWHAFPDDTVSSAEFGGTWEPHSGRVARVLTTFVTTERFSLCCSCVPGFENQRDGLHVAVPASPCPAPVRRRLAVCSADRTGGPAA